MIIFAVLLSVFLALILYGIRGFSDVADVAAFFLGIITLVTAITVPVARYESHVFYLRFQIAKAIPMSNMPGATTGWQVYVADLNARMAALQVLNAGIFDIWIDDEVDSVTPVLP